jgi:hypothetical protein
MTRKQASAHFNIPLGTIIRRVWLKWPMDKVFASPGRKHRLYVRVNGERVLLTSAVPYDSPRYNRARNRLMVGWPEELALAPAIGAQSHAALMTPWGVLSVNATARKIGVNDVTLRSRLKRWSYHDALNTPPYGVRGEHFILPPDEFARRLYATRKRYGSENETDRCTAHSPGL